MMGSRRHQGNPQTPRGVFGWDKIREASRRHPTAAAYGMDILLGVAVEDNQSVIDRILEEFLLETP